MEKSVDDMYNGCDAKMADKILKNPCQNSCQTTYRRSKLKFTGEVNQEIRFGAFASTSKRTDLTTFGKETCFHIKTCFGAYLKHYPILGDHEQEVLIPPYEKRPGQNQPTKEIAADHLAHFRIIAIVNKDV
ncbi:hypothetical protein WMY93_014872 [Mugilogobius chulae]|uniref:NAD(P)(+)--arginine ADP-ribosyltransferase n=1 Tax=Mugilogobius chulae TaxID=88201 RepID=A0AAW0P6H4_9GOBI